MEVNFNFHLQSIDQCRFICTAPMSLLHFNKYGSCNILLHIANSKMMKISQMQDRNPYYQPGDYDYMGEVTIWEGALITDTNHEYDSVV